MIGCAGVAGIVGCADIGRVLGVGERCDRVELAPATGAGATLAVGDSLRLFATLSTRGTASTPGRQCSGGATRWSSSDTAVARVVAGVVHGVAPGAARITAAASDASDAPQASLRVDVVPR